MVKNSQQCSASGRASPSISYKSVIRVQPRFLDFMVIHIHVRAKRGYLTSGFSRRYATVTILMGCCETEKRRDENLAKNSQTETLEEPKRRNVIALLSL